MGLPTRPKVAFYHRVWADRRVPLMAQLLVPLTILYLLLPFDIIPDFAPAVGQLDDLVVVALALALFVRLRPTAVLEEHLARVLEGS